MKLLLLQLFALLTLTRTAAQFSPPVVIVHSPFYEYHHRPYDWDGDGDLDYIGGYEETVLHLYENTGGGQLANPVVIDTFNFNWNLLGAAEFGDWNADGRTDIIFPLYPDEIQICMQLPNGQFAAPITLSDVTGTYTDTQLADLDGDGDTDLVIMLAGLRWYENDGLGDFSAMHFIENVPEPLFQIADADADGLLDIFTFDYASDSLRLLHNLGGTQFSSARVAALPPYFLGALIVTDLDGDGLPDLLPGGTGAPDNWWLRNTGNGYYAPAQALDPTASWLYWPQGSGSAAGDLDGDGDIDVVSKGVDTIVWYENIGNAVFNTHFLSTGLTVLGLNTPYIHDWNEDGRSDIVYSSIDAIAFYPNQGSGQFAPLQYIAPELLHIGSPVPTDINGDGLLDLWINGGPDYRVAWYPNLGADQWGDRQIIDYEQYYLLFQIPSDLDNDGDSDLLIGKQDADGGMQIAHELATYENLGAGQFGPAKTITTMRGVAAWTADVDADGDLDIIGTFEGAVPSGAWLPNDGSGHFGLPVFIDPGSDTSTVLDATDLDKDGDTDLLLQLKIGLSWYANDGAGVYEGPYLLSSEVSSYSLLGALDLDNDNLPDLIYQNQNGLVWAHNPGNGDPVGPPQQVGPTAQSIPYIYGASLADLNGDGQTDILAMFQDHAYGWIPNLGGGVFGERIILGVDEGHFTASLSCADLNGDGDQDFIYAKTSELGYYTDFDGLPTVSGLCFLDENENGQQDPGEAVLPGITVSLTPAATLSNTDDQGVFRFYAPSGQYTLGFQADACWALTTDSIVFHLSLPLPAGKVFGFGFRPDSNFTQISTVVASSQPICGQTVPFWLTLRNDGCYAAKARYRFMLGSQLTLGWADPAPFAIVGDTIIWETDSPLQAGETRNLEAFVTIAPAVAGDVPVVIGIAETLAANGVTVLHADTFAYPVPVLCSYDPNDKLVSATELPPNYAPDSSLLTYTIRFQNTGNFTAFNIRVRDTLDAALDWNSFEPLAASHPYFATLDKATGLAQFDFLDIRLADHLSNELASHGFVTFSIRLKPGLPPGFVTRNRAGIYFDVNAPVITNWAETKVRTVVSTRPDLVVPSVNIAPNPNSGTFRFELPTAAAPGMSFRIVGLTGQVFKEQSTNPGSTLQTVQAGDLPEGLYFLQVISEGKVLAVEKFVKQ